MGYFISETGSFPSKKELQRGLSLGLCLAILCLIQKVLMLTGTNFNDKYAKKTWTPSLPNCILLVKYLLEYTLTQNETLEILFT